MRHRPRPTGGVGIVAAWRGTIVHRAELDDDGRLDRVKVVDPSFLNWPALPVSLADTMVPDFPLANKGFNLFYAGNDLSCQETQCDLHHAPIRPARTRSRRTDDDTQLPGRG